MPCRIIKAHEDSFPRIDFRLLVLIFAMLVAAMLGTLFARRTVLPDCLGYVINLATETQYLEMPDGGADSHCMDWPS